MNPHAFPGTQYADGVSPTGHNEGMTLRDYFAAKAMAATLPSCHRMSIELALCAKESYAMADAMLTERDK